MIEYDFPAVIDHILKTSEKSKYVTMSFDDRLIKIDFVGQKR